MKTCRRCGKMLALAEFNFKDRARGRRQAYCRGCSRSYVREHYPRNVAYYVNKAKKAKPWNRRTVHERMLA